MNSFFCTIGEKLAGEIDAVPNPLLSGDATERNSNVKFRFGSITVKEIRDAIAKIKTTKGFGKDNISCYFLKLAMPFIEKLLADLFNTSIETSQFPDLWKSARVTPIFKEGDKAEMSNYRPISALPVIARLFEKRIANKLYQHMNDNGYFSSEQSGFLRLHSTVTSLIKSTDNWYNGMDLGKLTGVFFIDLKKAFDTVDHDILCQKLECYGIQGRGLAWFRSYLSNRKQYTRVNGVDSSSQELKIGVPQGSCLGPLIFLIYINDLARALKISRMSMFADDSCLYHQSSDISLLNEAINEDLRYVDNWLKGNKLSLNVMKTYSMLISTKPKLRALKSKNESLRLKIHVDELEVVQKTKYLGVQIDNSLDWKEHIKVTSSKVSKAVGFLRHAKHFLPEETLKTLYTGIIEPHFLYCCLVWGCSGVTEINQLQKLQSRAARIVTGSSLDTPFQPLIKELGWKTIDQLITSETKIMVFKSLYELAPQYMCNLFTRASQLTSRYLRNTLTDLRLPKKNSKTGQKCFSFRGAKAWNDLSAEGKLTSSLASFKKNLHSIY